MTTATARLPHHERTRAAAGRPPRTRSDSAWAWLWYGVSAGLLAVVLGLAVVAIAVPRLFGAVPLTVLSSSMAPSLPRGTLIVVQPLTQQELHTIRIGDVISYQPNPLDPTLITHRVTGITAVADGSFIFATRGDANAVEDPPVRSIQVRATLWYSIPGLGWVNDLVNAPGAGIWVVPTAAGLLFAYTGYTIASAVVEKQKKRRGADAAAEAPADDAATASAAP